MASQHVNAGMPEDFSEVLNVGVLGAGAFGTSMATVAARRGHKVVMWSRDEKQVQTIQKTRRNPKHDMQKFELPANLMTTHSLKDVCQGAHILILALPAQQIPEFCRQHGTLIEKTTIICNTAKGLYVPTQQLLSDAVLEAMERPDQPYVVLSGPSFAVEIMKNMPTAVVVASRLLYHAVTVQRTMSSLTFRINISQDLVGVQLGGALKNPLAIGAGMIEEAGLGMNALTAYVTRSSNELRSLSIAMGGHPDTITGLSGVGDLMLTAFGSLSRNREMGRQLMKGENVEDLLKEKTVEGVPTAKVAVIYAKRCGLETPIFDAIHKLLHEGMKPTAMQCDGENFPLNFLSSHFGATQAVKQSLSRLVRTVNYEAVLQGREFKLDALNEDDQRKVVIMALHCCLNGPVGVKKSTYFPLIDETTSIEAVAKCCNRQWKKFCLCVVKKIPPEVAQQSWIYQATGGILWPLDEAQEYLNNR